MLLLLRGRSLGRESVRREKTVDLAVDLQHLLTVEASVSATLDRVKLVWHADAVGGCVETNRMVMRYGGVGIPLHGEDGRQSRAHIGER